MTSQAGRIVDALSAACVAHKELLNSSDFKSFTFIVNIDRTGVPRLVFRAEARGYDREG